MRRVLVLRPQPGASATAERARTLGLTPVAIPLFTIEPVEWQVPDLTGFDALLLTSANAARCGGPGLRELLGLPVLAVGKSTAEAAHDAGFAVSTTGESGVEALLASMRSDTKLLHLCGEDRKIPVAEQHAITPLVVYRAVPVEAPDLAAAEGAVAMIHSPRAGRRFAALVGDRGSIAIAAISPAAACAAGSGWERVEAAGRPRDEALLALAASLCNKPVAQ